jgi:hypothetical protein
MRNRLELKNTMQQVGCNGHRRLGYGLVGVALIAGLGAASGCGEGDDAPTVADDAIIGSLSPAQLTGLCEEIREGADARDSLSCAAGSYQVIVANEAPCDGEAIRSALCDLTAGELRACTAAGQDDPCGETAAALAACAPLTQKGCAATNPAPWAGRCPGLAATLSPFEGIYEVVRHTENTSGCDAEGPSVLEADVQPFFVVATVILRGSPIGSLESCNDLADCRAAAAQLRQYGLRTDVSSPGFRASPELSQSLVCDATLEGALASSSLAGRFDDPDPSVCSLAQTDETITRAPDGALRIEGRTFDWQTPRDEDGFCSYSSDEGQLPDGAVCRALEVYEARFLSAS